MRHLRSKPWAIPAVIWLALIVLAVVLWTTTRTDPLTMQAVGWFGGVAFAWMVLETGVVRLRRDQAR